MIASLEGIIEEKLFDQVILDVHGVGYGLYVTSEDHGRLEQGKPARLLIYEHIRENSHDLFGFMNRETKSLFELLLSVNGVGPKMALNMLSIGSSNEVRAAIAGGDVKIIQRANGVGKRLAERVVVDLKDKVGLSGVDLASTGILNSEAGAMGDEAVQALMSLGFNAPDAQLALKDIDKTMSVEDRVRLALKGGK
jgi:holliday junction DNA helicase RuvA